MGVLCSTVDKDGIEPPESKTQTQFLPRSPRTHRLLRKMPQMEMPGTTTRSKSWARQLEFATKEEYDETRERLQLAEKNTAFDALVASQATYVETKAAALVKKIKDYDWRTTYDLSHDAAGHSTSVRPDGEHFLGNIDRINRSALFQVARKMPKGAHLHIHFNSCLPAHFLIREAGDINAMYIRSTEPLNDPKNFDLCHVSFMVMSDEDAYYQKNSAGERTFKPLGDIWSPDYIRMSWMRYKDFYRRFPYDWNGTPYGGREGAEAWLESKMVISEEEAHGVHQTGRGIWAKFNFRTQMMKGLFAYETAFRKYTRACIKDFVADNIQYAEIRPNFMSTNSLKSDDGKAMMGNAEIMQIIKEELEATMLSFEKERQYFGGMKVIYCTPRSFDRKKIENALQECIKLKVDFPDLLCGFDLVGHEEMGNELRNFVPEFLEFRQKCKTWKDPKDGKEAPLDIPFLFHCGETLDVGGKVDGNLYDAILLNSKRIGHGYALARHPFLMDIFRERKIAVESCPISNEILGLTPTIAGHNLPVLLANNVPCTINSDNATFYKSSLSHDFYQAMIGSESMNLYGWKQLALWSIEHSCMDQKEKDAVTAEWERKWAGFCQWIVDTYSRIDESDWKPPTKLTRDHELR